ncbi:acyltransferase family protein [Spongisporangium articulatum]|uniref:Acyltransferase family protein n=1 Tax=Spongisporangium articulatum TaxID=3362603 RepID=A0ABW8ARE7_9ACTN
MTAPPEPTAAPVAGREVTGAAQPPSSQARATGRRPALDGVRALAVASVAVYHFGGGDSSWLPGGFLGVDVFFVLSGYLITSLLLAEHARTGTISLAGFWARRVKRLAPALMLMLLVVCGWLWWAGSPADWPDRRYDVFWTLGYLANWHLAGADSYFAAYGTASPLRHTWSLAVEEQFYFVWPALTLGLLWAGGRVARATRDWPVMLTGRRMLAGVALLGALASAGAMAWLYSPDDASLAYYSTRGRVQELFAGVLLAIVLAARPLRPRRWVTGAATVGLVVLAGAFLTLPDTAPLYYRGGALGVSVAVALLIAGLEREPEGRLARAFSWGPAAWLGRISYGVYLWHWPVVVAVPLQGSFGEEVARQALRVALTVGLSVASYYGLERPVQRSVRLRGRPGRVLAAMVASIALVVAVAIPATALPGTIAAQLTTPSDRGCPGETVSHLTYCVWPDQSVAPTVAVLGDSTARALSPGLDAWASANDATWIEAAWKRCTATGLLVRATVPVDEPAKVCAAQARARITSMLNLYHPETVLVAEFWPNHQPLIVNGRTLMPGTAEHDAALRAGYTEIVDEVAAHGGRVVFLELPPPGDGIGAQVAAGRPAATAQPKVPGRYVDDYNAVLRSVAEARPDAASTVSVTDVICPGGSCAAIRDGLLIRGDGVHYSVGFSKQLVPVLMRRAGVAS